MDVNHKSDFRKSCIKKLNKISPFAKYYKNKIILKELEKLLKKTNSKNILIYIPFGFEVDVNPLIKKLRKDKRNNIYVPYMFGDSFKAVKYRLPLKKGKFGIYEPKNSFLKARKIDLAIVPVVGIDKLNKRIGFGKGMYDRFFDRLNYDCTLVFTQVTLCKSKQILSQEHDIKADFIITS